jgi:hypothetical protein
LQGCDGNSSLCGFCFYKKRGGEINEKGNYMCISTYLDFVVIF